MPPPHNIIIHFEACALHRSQSYPNVSRLRRSSSSWGLLVPSSTLRCRYATTLLRHYEQKCCEIGSSADVFEHLDIDHHIWHALLLGLLPDVSLLLPKLDVWDVIADAQDDFSEQTHNDLIFEARARVWQYMHTAYHTCLPWPAGSVVSSPSGSRSSSYAIHLQKYICGHSSEVADSVHHCDTTQFKPKIRWMIVWCRLVRLAL